MGFDLVAVDASVVAAAFVVAAAAADFGVACASSHFALLEHKKNDF